MTKDDTEMVLKCNHCDKEFPFYNDAYLGYNKVAFFFLEK